MVGEYRTHCHLLISFADGAVELMVELIGMILGEAGCSRVGAVEKALVSEPYLLDDTHTVDLPCIDEV